jgi:AraC family transcriptional regulator of adaptative response/methylated-DNA-[protein]-cysteine methyltransferase
MDTTTFSPADQDAMYRALSVRDAAFRDRFFYGVMTTGVYCVPTCASRVPLRKNVRFYADAAQARADGLRACKRCRPDDGDPIAARVQRVRAMIEASETIPSLAALAEAVGVSPTHVQRQFTKLVGVSPWKYADSLRAARFRSALTSEARVTDAVYDAGYGAASRAYERADALGMTPRAFADGATGAITYSIVASALGRVLVAATERGVCSVRLGDDDASLEAELRAEFRGATFAREDAATASSASAIVDYLAGRGPWPTLAIDVRGTAFQRRVWDALRGIACGTTASYGELARALGDAKAARAVAAACAANPVALLVPCHRIVPKAGGTGGYRWGAERKRALLALERGA